MLLSPIKEFIPVGGIKSAIIKLSPKDISFPVSALFWHEKIAMLHRTRIIDMITRFSFIVFSL